MTRFVVFFLSFILFASGVGAETAETSDVDASPFANLESVKAFDQFMATLGELRATILTDARSDLEAAEGMRFLLRTVAMSQDVSGDGDPRAPYFARMDTLRRKIGGDNPDGEYDNLVFDGGTDYKITGNRGSVDHLSFTVLEVQPSGRSKSIGYLNERDLDLDDQGNFTLWLTTEKPAAPGNWIQTGASPVWDSMLVRQYIGDRASERLASYEIEVVGRKRYAPLPPATDPEVGRAIRLVGHALRGLGLLHHYVSPALGENPNSFRLRNSDDFGADISSIDNLYVIGTYDFNADEALIVEVEPMDVRFWNFAIENPWHESVDYMQRKTSRTHDHVVVDPDGKIRFLIAHARTDQANYLETGGHSRGFMTFRWVGERDTKAPLPTVTKLPLAEAVAKARELAGRD